MMAAMRHHAQRARLLLRRAGYAAAGSATVVLMRFARLFNRESTANLIGGFMRRIGPWLPEHRVGRANLSAAFPELPPGEIERILGGVWDNLGRVAAEFVSLDRLTLLRPGQAGDFDIEYDDASLARIQAIMQQPGPRVFFAAHLANWEIPAVVARHCKLDASILYRPPNMRAVADAVLKMRAGCMGTLIASGFDAPIRLAKALEQSGSAGMLLDQHERRGVDTVFFGRPCKTTPLLAQLARHFDCPIHGLRIIRLPARNRFRAEISDPITPMRDAEGRIDVAATTQVMTATIEQWVREHPEQWLWLHRRWR